MSTFDYARAVATADRLIKKFGQAGKVRRPTTTGPGYKPTAGAPDDHDARFAVIKFALKDVDGTRVLVTDKKVYLSAAGLPVVPTASDKLVEADGGELKIVAIEPLKPAGTVVFYEIQARR